MDTFVKSKNSASELNLKIQQHLEELVHETDKARRNEEMVRYLNFCAKFHQYSSSNIWLILIAKPDATHVAGFNAWKKMGRYVKRGEKGIKILAPHFWKAEDEEGKEDERIGFHIAHVFDISQTAGEPIPEQPNWKSPEKNQELQKKLIEFAESNGVKVTIEPLSGETQGVSMGGRIILSPEAGVKTLVHEIAHELLHQVEKVHLSRAEKEMQAEAIAFVVSRYFKIGYLESANYISFYGISSGGIMDNLRVITQYASKIIKYILNEKQ